MPGGAERLLRAADRFQQRHTILAVPVGAVRKFGDDQARKHAALLGYALADNPQLQQQIIDASVAQFPVLGSELQGSIRVIQGSGRRRT